MAFSCKGRGLCPSCGAKRAAELGAFLVDEVVEDAGQAQWVFTVPKMLWVYFLMTQLAGVNRFGFMAGQLMLIYEADDGGGVMLFDGRPPAAGGVAISSSRRGR